MSLQMARNSISRSTSLDPTFQEMLAVFITASTIQGKVINNMETNLWLLIAGSSSITHKSSAEECALSITSARIAPLGTAKGLVPFLHHPGNIILHSDEFCEFLKQSHRGSTGYRAAMDMLNTLYGGTYHVPAVAREEECVLSTHPSLLGSTTLEMLVKNVTPEFMEGGMFKRMLTCIPGKAPYRSMRDMESPKYPLPGITLDNPITIPDEVWETHDNFMREKMAGDDFLAGCWQRGEANIFKIAAVYCLARAEGLELNTEDWQYARKLVETSIGFQYLIKTMASNNKR